MKKPVDNIPKPVDKIEVNESHLKLRVILFILSFCVVIVCAIIIFVNYLKEDDGWSVIEANPQIDLNCSQDFVLSYDLGNSDESSTKEARRLTQEYSLYIDKAYSLFNSYKEYDGIYNIAYINNHYNEEISVDPLLYNAFSLMEEANYKMLYLAPITLYYDDVINASNQDDLNNLDPHQNANVKQYFLDIIEYVNNGDINLKLLGDNKINLSVSNEYVSFLNEYGITQFINIGWIKNAFIIDYVAEGLVDAGFSNGTLSSYDGYSRNLDNTNTYNYILNILDSPSGFPSVVGKVAFKESISVVQFRDFMFYQSDITRYKEVDSGVYRHYYYDCNDGLSKSSINSLTCYSNSLGCAQIALRSFDLYITDLFEFASNEDIDYIFCDGSKISYTQNIKIEGLYNNYEEVYIND